LQSGKPAASGGFVELLVEGEPVAVEFVLVFTRKSGALSGLMMAAKLR
jgi:hypothetical protein